MCIFFFLLKSSMVILVALTAQLPSEKPHTPVSERSVRPVDMHVRTSSVRTIEMRTIPGIDTPLRSGWNCAWMQIRSQFSLTYIRGNSSPLPDIPHPNPKKTQERKRWRENRKRGEEKKEKERREGESYFYSSLWTSTRVVAWANAR